MKSIAIAALLLLVPAMLVAEPTMGVYFTYDPYLAHYSPAAPGEMFDGYLYAHNTDCYLTAVEFMLHIGTPAIGLTGFEIPDGSLNLGNPISGMSITYWPPLDGWNPGYNFLATFHFFALDFCECLGGTLPESMISILPHPDTGFVRGTCWPDNEFVYYVGLTSTICPKTIGTTEESWGAIKHMLQ